MRKIQRTHFTLIELLVVIAIILVLAGMLLAVISKARARGRHTVCLNNLKQFGLATALYTDENNGYLPNHSDDNSGSNWRRAVFLPHEYFQNNWNTILCPEDRDVTRPPETYGATFNYNASRYYWSYCYNMRMAASYPSATYPITVRLSEFVQPTSTITFFEGNENDGGVENEGGDGPTDAPTMEPYVRHFGGADYLFADAHAEYRRPESLTLAYFTTIAD